jgi:hypothetical protein
MSESQGTEQGGQGTERGPDEQGDQGAAQSGGQRQQEDRETMEHGGDQEGQGDREGTEPMLDPNR